MKMELKILKENEQPLLSRIEIQSQIVFDSVTPTRQEVRKKISETIKKEEPLVLISKIEGAYGRKTAKVTAHVYETKEQMEKIASKTIKKRMGMKTEEAKDESADKPSEPEKKSGA